jgi:hypothetical protein
MASLLDRLSVPGSGSAGPVRRARSGKGDRSPYAKPDSLPPKGDVDGQWRHDLYENNGLSQRLSDNATSRNAPRYNAGAAARALSEAAGVSGGSINIKGASGAVGNVVEVRGLVAGTSADDVKAIFQQCGPVTESKLMSTKNGGDVVVRVVFKNPKDAQAAVIKFDGQNADGKRLGVKILGSVSAGLSHRLANPPTIDGSVDALIGDSNGGSKLRSDAIMAADSRASVLTAPPGTAEANQGRGGRGRGRGRHHRRGGPKGQGRGGATMDVD